MEMCKVEMHNGIGVGDRDKSMFRDLVSNKYIPGLLFLNILFISCYQLRHLLK